MAISSLDQLIAANAAGQSFKYIWCKQNTTGQAPPIGKWSNTATWGGNPCAMIYNVGPVLSGSFPGSQFIADTSPYLIGTIPHGGNVAPFTKYLTSIEIIAGTVATTVPSWLMLVDLLTYYPGLNLNSSANQVLNSVDLPRYTTGAGVQMFIENVGASGTSASTFSTSAFLYTNSTNSPNYQPGGGLTIPWAINAGGTASNAAQILHSGIVANCAGPFIPLAAGDLGVKSIQQVYITATGTATTGTLIQCKPLVTIPLHQLHFSSGRDFVFHIPTLPVIYDGACLAFLLYTGAALATSGTLHAALDFVWG